MYAVIVFEETNEVELLPTNWITNQNTTFWPPYKSATALTKAIKDRAAPEESWAKFRIRVLCACRKCCYFLYLFKIKRKLYIGSLI